jgi:PPOX class probable F420-dependent enzyme
MPKPPLPPLLDKFLRQPNPAVMATLKPGGSPHTTATWYVWDGDRVLLSMDHSRMRVNHLRADSRVSITVLGGDTWYHHVTLVGRATLEPDGDLAHIDRLARHYTGEPYPARDCSRISAWVDVESWHAWEGSQPWAGSE